MSHWWRAHDDAIDNVKLGRLSDRLHRAWFNLNCLASANGGKLPAIGDVAFKLRVSEHKAAEIITALVVAGLYEKVDTGFEPHNWALRQFKSDATDPTNATRQKRYRDRHPVTGNTVTETVTVTPPRVQTTEAETERENSEPRGSAADAAPATEVEILNEDPKARLFRLGKTILVSFGVAEKRTGSLIGQWLKARNDPAGLLAAIQFARDQNVAEPVAYVSAMVSGKGKQNGGFGALASAADDLIARRKSEAGEDAAFTLDLTPAGR